MAVESPEFLIIDEAVKAWEQKRSPEEILAMYDHFMESQRSEHLNDQKPQIEGVGIVNHSLAQLAAEAEGPDHMKFVFGAIELLEKYNERRDFRALALALFAADLRARGLKSEGKSLARLLQKREAPHLKNEPVLKELIEETLAA